MTETVETVKTEDMPPLDEDPEVENEDTERDVVQYESEKSETPNKTCQIVEGKREKKVVQRLDMQMCKPKEKAKIESTGKGAKLGDIARINHSIGKLKAPLLKPLHKIVYDRPGAASSLRKNLRLFNGFTFDVDSDPYSKKLLKVIRLPKTQLKTICQTLDLERSGKQSVLAERIMTFLLSPTNSGKPVLKKKKRKTTKDVKGDKSSSKSKKTQKKVEGGKSRAIVTDSSSDEDDDDDDDEEEKKDNNKSTEKSMAVSQKRKNSESQSSDKDEDDEDDVNEEDGEEKQNDVPEEDSEEEKKSPRKKKSPAKKAIKKSEQKSDELTTDDSDQCSKEDKTVKKTTKKPAAKRKAPVKPVPKTKKADSSSNRGKKTASKSKCDDSDSSDDDQPLIKMIKKPPTDDQLKTTIQDLLKDANLEEVTMKQLCRQVFDKYPDFDLTSRKDFIKDTVKSVIS
ncbi:protein DEK [Triplophysa dalaica]|uniref:protein DEK n=1 Tax=Triplophysa dalaica TaxID=1582913 RepID=UPI0024E0195A|nr:protein DEK [Triplophysa dalaica]